MEYGITLCTLGANPVLTISAEEYADIEAAQHNVLLMLGIEEKFDALLQNYAELECELLRLAVEHMIFTKFEWSTFTGEIHTVNRRLANLLTLSRVYTDHAKHDLNRIYGSNNQVTAKLTAALSEAYDKCLGYRVMEALRNHLQHSAFPISQLSYPNEWLNVAMPNALLRSRVLPVIDVEQLRANGDFKSSVLRELQEVGDTSPKLMLYVREYVEHLSRVHDSLRAMCTEIGAWSQKISDTIERYKKLAGNDAIGIVFVKEDE